MAELGPYSRESALIRMDGRTREARILRKVKADLAEHVGGRPTATQKAIIDRAAWLSLHLAQLDARAVEAGGVLSERDARQYLAWSNALTRTVARLGPGKAREAAPDLETIIAEHRREDAA